ncbi:MAG TPA: hypothetical protein DEO54_03755 [Rikenellaceae bacterium]|nr:MAG: hypothetical protein A2X20_04645 [Bacteroidetes bacterium GWE2_40_15]HBZ25342.1 hypothetical protein [Rikenellaceae bacterium]
MKKLLLKITKYAAITLTVIIALMLILPTLFSGKIKKQIETLINSSVNATVTYKDPRLTFFAHFPVLTVTIGDFSVSGVPGYEKDTLFAGERLSLGVDILSLLRDSLSVESIYGKGLKVSIIMGADGKTNFDIFPKEEAADTTESDGTTSDLYLKKIVITDSRLNFFQESTNMRVVFDSLNYRGNGQIKAGELKLFSLLDAQKFSFSFDGIRYIEKRKSEIQVTTTIDSTFTKYALADGLIKIEGVSASFAGEIEAPQKGLIANFKLSSNTAKLNDIASLLPPDYSLEGKNIKLLGDASFEVKLTGGSGQLEGSYPDLWVGMNVSDGYIKEESAPVPVESINMSASIEFPGLEFAGASFVMNNLTFKLDTTTNRASFTIKTSSDVHISADISGGADMSLFTKALGLKGYSFGGELSYSIKANGIFDQKRGVIPVTDAIVTVANGSITTPYISESLEEINAKISLRSVKGGMRDLILDFDPLKFKFVEGPFTLDCRLENFENLKYSITSNGVLNLNRIYAMFAIDSASVNGVLNTDFVIKGDQLSITKGDYDKIEGRGTLELDKFEYKSAGYIHPFKIPSATFQFERERAILSNTTIVYGSNKITLDGFASNYVDYYMSKGVLSGTLSMRSDRIILDDFIALIPQSDTTKTQPAPKAQPSTGVILIPDKLNIYLKSDVKRVDFESIIARDFKGEVAISEKSMYINGTGVNIAGAQFLLDAVYKPINERLAQVQMHARADSFDIGRVYKEIPMIRELFSSAKNMEGLISMDYKLSTKLDASMMPVYPSVKGEGFIKLEDVNVRGLKVLGAISKATGKDSLSNPNLKSVLIKTKIADNIIKIERTKMRILGFRPRFEGEASLDGKLNINFRLGLPPFGLIGIPLTITGTMDNPNVEVRKGREEDKLDEIEEEDEEKEVNEQKKTTQK